MRRFVYSYLPASALASIVVAPMLVAANTYAQILGFYPQADTIHIGGGCTTPIITCESPLGDAIIDTIRIEPGWNTWIWKLNEYGEEELIDRCFFLVLDSLNKFDYQMWYQSEKPLPPKRIQVQFDSSFYCEEYVFRLELLVREAQIAVDSVFQVFKTHVGIGVKNSRGDISPPQSYNLLQNYPNSFNSCTQISLWLNRHKILLCKKPSLMKILHFLNFLKS